MKRRQFLQRSGLAAAAGWYPAVLAAAQSSQASPPGRSFKTDVLIVGGGLGGCAAALAACRMGKCVVLTEPTDWIGGQLTQQAVPPDEHRWIEEFGCTQSYRQLREHIRAYYRRYYSLSERGRAQKFLNPGSGSVSRLCHEPRVALAVLQGMLAPAVGSGRLTLLLNSRPVSADVDADSVRCVEFIQPGGERLSVEAAYTIDASETGELLPLTGTEYVTGCEARSDTHEPTASEQARPANMQAVTWCFAMDYCEGEDHTITKPVQYEFWRSYRPDLSPPWPEQPLLSLWYSNPHTREPKQLAFVPPDSAFQDHRTTALNLWIYRRIIHHENFAPGVFSSGITVVNWPQNDYMLGNVFEVGEADRQRHMEGAAQLSLSLLYWLQTEAPRPDGGAGWPGLRLRGDVVGTDHGLAKFPYIRESRRIKAEFTITEQDLRGPGGRRIGGHTVAPQVADSVGIGHYGLDTHPTTGGDNYYHVSCPPFQIPLGALLPKRMKNLIAGCKNIGTTHRSNGAYRLHPVEWNIGEAAGALAAFCLQTAQPPTQVRNHPGTLGHFQQLLTKQGFELDWDKLRGG
jgi:hypothetical protein